MPTALVPFGTLTTAEVPIAEVPIAEIRNPFPWVTIVPSTLKPFVLTSSTVVAGNELPITEVMGRDVEDNENEVRNFQYHNISTDREYDDFQNSRNQIHVSTIIRNLPPFPED